LNPRTLSGSTLDLIQPRNGSHVGSRRSEAPRYLIRDWDWVYAALITCRVRAMSIRDKAIAPGPPWQIGFAEKADRIDGGCIISTTRLLQNLVFGTDRPRRLPNSGVAPSLNRPAS